MVYSDDIRGIPACQWGEKKNRTDPVLVPTPTDDRGRSYVIWHDDLTTACPYLQEGFFPQQP